ncbi:MAG TPA: hypothetical protein DIU07_00200 [Rhodobacteraceae bacterium]|nr:hypothetical protein [Paracoccaceae bacterium]
MNRGYDWLVTRLAVPAYIWLVRTIWVVSLSFQPNEVLAHTTSSTSLGVLPIPFTAENYGALVTHGQTPWWFLNSMIVSLGMTFGVLMVSTTAGYALARLTFPFNRVLIVVALIGLMLPEQAVPIRL